MFYVGLIVTTKKIPIEDKQRERNQSILLQKNQNSKGRKERKRGTRVTKQTVNN